MKKLLALTAGFIGYCFYRGHKAKSTKVEVKEDLRRWEGEGGNVPAVATPSPAPAPQSSPPVVDPVIRH